MDFNWFSFEKRGHGSVGDHACYCERKYKNDIYRPFINIVSFGKFFHMLFSFGNAFSMQFILDI